MKVVIIGGGIGGLTLGILLQQKNINVVVNERSAGMPTRGHAFLMHSDGLAVLNQMATESDKKLPGKKVDAFSLRRPDGEEIKHLQLNAWQCIKRADLIGFLYSILPEENVRVARTFDHFVYEKDRVVAAKFTNGDIEYGDIFVGADGGNSRVRELIAGKVDFSPVMVKEVVGIAYNEKIAKTHPSIFVKFQDKTKGLAFGLIPTSGIEFVWFLQYDPAISDVADTTPEELKAFCYELLKDFPPIVTDLLDSNNFATSYIWNTRDFDLLPSFHHDNVVLLGDAAHLALPFTSAGTTNAIIDAKALAQCLEDSGNYETAFWKYYELRAKEVSKHIGLGRHLKKQFLSPQEHHDDDIPVPLISSNESNDVAAKSKQIQVLYFTDPICSTCWIIQPLLRKLKLEYDNYLNVEYCMGGLLPSWDQYNKGKISNPNDAAKHWEEVCALHEMPLDGDIWKEDPLNSSYPPSIAFKAAQMQDTNKAILFLRRIKEMVFLEKKNIIKWEFLKTAAFEVGLDSARLFRDFQGKAMDLFREDLVLSEQLGVTGFPTLFFCDSSGKRYPIKGFQPYEIFEEIIQQLVPNARKEEIDTDPENLFTHFPTMTDKEFAFLSNISRTTANNILTHLYDSGRIDKYESKNGVIWISKFAVTENA